jgi:hypothetical protein
MNTLKNKLCRLLHRWRIVDTHAYRIIPYNVSIFRLTPKEKEMAEKLYNEKGTISYEFYPCAGIAFGVKIHVLKTSEIIDISDVSSW